MYLGLQRYIQEINAITVELLVEMYNFDKHLDIRLSKYIRQDHLICRNAETC